jgi:CRISPR-associated protein Cas2
MSMTVVVTRNVSGRMRGFLASSMLELAPGVYSAPKMSPAVRKRVWSVVTEWFYAEQEASVVLLWADPAQPGGQSVKTLGLPPVSLIDLDGLLVTHRKNR